MLLYADEDLAYPATVRLRQLGHDVLTAQEDGRRGSSDAQVRSFAYTLGRAVLTYNRKHFKRLHRQNAPHSGIISATDDKNLLALAARINTALIGVQPGRWHLRVNRPP